MYLILTSNLCLFWKLKHQSFLSKFLICSEERNCVRRRRKNNNNNNNADEMCRKIIWQYEEWKEKQNIFI